MMFDPDDWTPETDDEYDDYPGDLDGFDLE